MKVESMKNKSAKNALIKELSRKRAADVRFDGTFISLTFDGKRLRCKAVAKRHEPNIADWSRSKREVYFDADIKWKDLIPILLHEVIEKYVTEKHRLDVDMQSHRVAQAVERTFLHRRAWKRHESRVAHLWRRENG